MLTKLKSTQYSDCVHSNTLDQEIFASNIILHAEIFFSGTEVHTKCFACVPTSSTMQEVWKPVSCLKILVKTRHVSVARSSLLKLHVTYNTVIVLLLYLNKKINCQKFPF